MSAEILNEKPFPVYVIIAETLQGWKDPDTEEGKRVLMEHYRWGASLKAGGKLILAGPMDIDLISTKRINPIGQATGLIMLKADTREEAEEWAFQDPFHTNGFRINRVHSMKITMTDDSIFRMPV